MTAIITGDIIGSRNISPSRWLGALKKELKRLGQSPRKWEIFGGDSFQAEAKNAVEALETAVRIKAAVRAAGANVRLAIGVGSRSYRSRSLTQSAGSAFTYSGETLTVLKKLRITLAIRTGNTAFDRDMNLYLRLALLAMDRWTAKTAATVMAVLDNPGASQQKLGKKLGIGQNAVSMRLQRANLREIMDLVALYREKVKVIAKS